MREMLPPLDLDFTRLVFTFVAFASPVPIGGMRTESNLGSGVVGRDLTCVDIFFVGDGTSSSDVPRLTLRLRFLADEGPSCICWGGWLACREGEETSPARPEDLPVLGLRFCTDPRETTGSSTCI